MMNAPYIISTTLTLLLLQTSKIFAFSIQVQVQQQCNTNNNNCYYHDNNNSFKRWRNLQNNVHMNTRRSDGSYSQLKMVKKVNADDTPLRFLGKGDRAVVRPGVVLVAPEHEFSHWLMKSAVFVHAIGVDEYGDHVTRGVIIDHPTAFTMGEMGSVYGTLAHNLLFRGGDAGNDSAIILHSYGEECEAEDGSGNTKVNSGDMIGTSGVFEGGLDHAMELADDGLVDPERFKFFFNYVEFNDNQLTNILAETDSDGDAWASFEVPSSMILNNDFTRGDAWSYLRNQMKQMMVR